MSGRIAASEVVPGMVISMQSASWVVETVETVATSAGQVLRFATRGLRTGSRKPIVINPKHSVRAYSPRTAPQAV